MAKKQSEKAKTTEKPKAEAAKTEAPKSAPAKTEASKSAPAKAKNAKGAAASKADAPKADAAKGKSAAKSSKPKPMSKNAVYQAIADETKLSRKQVSDVFEAMKTLMEKEVSSKSTEVFTVPPGLIKVKRALKKATAAREGRNLRTGEIIQIPAKPERTVIRAQVLKTVKEMAQK